MTHSNQHTDKIQNKNLKTIGQYSLVFITVFLIVFVSLRFDFSMQWIQSFSKQENNELRAYHLFYNYMRNENRVDDVVSLNYESVLLVNTTLLKTQENSQNESDYVVIFYLGYSQFDYCPIYLDKPISEQCQYHD
jgi:hypothetical protein